MRPSDAWDIWDTVRRAKKNALERGGITWLLKTLFCVASMFEDVHVTCDSK